MASSLGALEETGRHNSPHSNGPKHSHTKEGCSHSPFQGLEHYYYCLDPPPLPYLLDHNVITRLTMLPGSPGYWVYLNDSALWLEAFG